VFWLKKAIFQFDLSLLNFLGSLNCEAGIYFFAHIWAAWTAYYLVHFNYFLLNDVSRTSAGHQSSLFLVTYLGVLNMFLSVCRYIFVVLTLRYSLPVYWLLTGWFVHNLKVWLWLLLHHCRWIIIYLMVDPICNKTRRRTESQPRRLKFSWVVVIQATLGASVVLKVPHQRLVALLVGELFFRGRWF
jgi:hypothetical protein